MARSAKRHLRRPDLADSASLYGSAYQSVLVLPILVSARQIA